MNFETHQKDLSRRPWTSMSGIVPGIQLNPSDRNTWLDFALALISLATIMTAYGNTPAHKWLAGGLTVLVLVHLAFHRVQIQGFGKHLFRQKPVDMWLKIIIDMMLAIDFLLLVLSGLIIAIIYAPHITQFHNHCFFVFINLLTAHLFLNRKWISKLLKNKFSIKNRRY